MPVAKRSAYGSTNRNSFTYIIDILQKDKSSLSHTTAASGMTTADQIVRLHLHKSVKDHLPVDTSTQYINR
jgi:hypothetical protein